MFPTREPGTFKMHEDDNGDILATPTKVNILDSSPSHLFAEHDKTLSRIDESKLSSTVKSNIMKEHKSDPVSPQLIDDVTREPSLEPNHSSNVLDQRLASVASASNLDLAVA